MQQGLLPRVWLEPTSQVVGVWSFTIAIGLNFLRCVDIFHLRSVFVTVQLTNFIDRTLAGECKQHKRRYGLKLVVFISRLPVYQLADVLYFPMSHTLRKNRQNSETKVDYILR